MDTVGRLYGGIEDGLQHIPTRAEVDCVHGSDHILYAIVTDVR